MRSGNNRRNEVPGTGKFRAFSCSIHAPKGDRSAGTVRKRVPFRNIVFVNPVNLILYSRKDAQLLNIIFNQQSGPGNGYGNLCPGHLHIDLGHIDSEFYASAVLNPEDPFLFQNVGQPAAFFLDGFSASTEFSAAASACSVQEHRNAVTLREICGKLGVSRRPVQGYLFSMPGFS